MGGFFNFSRRIGLALFGAGLIAFGPTGVRADAGWSPDPEEQLLLEIRSGQLKIGTEPVRAYRTPQGTCLDFADLVMALDLPIRVDRKSRRATGWLLSEDRTFILDRTDNTVQIVNKRERLASRDLYDTPEGWCVDSAALSSWLGASILPDTANLAVQIRAGAQKLPFLEALQRKYRAAQLRPAALFDLNTLPRAAEPYSIFRAPSADVVTRLETTRRPNGAFQTTGSSEFYAAGEVGRASMDVRFLSTLQNGPQSLRVRAYRSDPSGSLMGVLKATHFGVGDISSIGSTLTSRSVAGRGAIITNRPLSQLDQLGTTTIRGSMPAGWDAELYRNGQLVGFLGESSDGRYEFPDVRLLFGENTLQVVLYGPQGQIRRETVSYPVGLDPVPPGKTYYHANAVQEGRDLINFSKGLLDPLTGWRWGVGVERGIDKRTLVGAQFQSLMFDDRRHSYFEGTVRRSFGPLLADFNGVQDLRGPRAGQLQLLGRIGSLSVTAHSLIATRGFASDKVWQEQKTEHALQADGGLQLGKLHLPFTVGARLAEMWDGRKVTEWLTQASASFKRVAMTARYSHSRTQGPQLVEREDDLDIIASAVFDRLALRGSAGFRLDRGNPLERLNAVAEYRLDDRGSLRAEVERDHARSTDRLSLGYVRRFDAFALRADGRIGNRRLLGLNLSVSFSLGPDPVRGGIRFSEEKLGQDGQAVVTVFRDDNANGRRDPGEETLEGVGIGGGLSRSSPTLTDASGRASLNGLRPYQPIVVAIDEASLPDQMLRPTSRGVVVVPRPGIAAEVAIGLSPTGEVEGTLIDANGDSLAGQEIEIVDKAGDVRVTTVSDYDGYFLAGELPYGRYQLRLKGIGGAPMIIATVEFDRSHSSLQMGRVAAPATRIAAASD